MTCSALQASRLLCANRTGKSIVTGPKDCFGIFGRLAGREYLYAADRLALDPVNRDIVRIFRAGVIPAIYARLEEAGNFYAIRLLANSALREMIARRLTRSGGQRRSNSNASMRASSIWRKAGSTSAG